MECLGAVRVLPWFGIVNFHSSQTDRLTQFDAPKMMVAKRGSQKAENNIEQIEVGNPKKTNQKTNNLAKRIQKKIYKFNKPYEPNKNQKPKTIQTKSTDERFTKKNKGGYVQKNV